MPSPNANASYQDLILEHAKHPRHLGPLADAERWATGINRLCGDTVTLYARGLGGAPAGVEVAFISTGCALCRASASILTEAAQGQLPAAAVALVSHLRASYPAPAGTPVPADLPPAVQALFDLRRYPTRERCVLLPWETLADILVGGLAT